MIREMTDSELLLTLIEARARIESPDHWTRFKGAELEDGTSVAIHHEDAVRFCAFGAVSRGRPIDEERPPLEICNALGFHYWHNVFDANDESTHATVLSWFDRGIAFAIKRMSEHSTEPSKQLTRELETA